MTIREPAVLLTHLEVAAMQGRSNLTAHETRSLLYTTQVLFVQRHTLAKLARPEHPNGGFFNPLIAWEAEALADQVLTDFGTAPTV
jgi:hypothetical protein